MDVRIPDRIADGYGLNEHLVQFAADEGRDMIVTCDNGIAAGSQIRLAKRAWHDGCCDGPPRGSV